ncbi:hypothetical protein [Hyphomonas sp.]|uniref:hypothetical protein n=1 Tax=Hyphomonas sp. TaxID=87 RepID=UPI0025BDF5A7|nr:hypothetical protein [Hyphomonas sp.]MBI1399102.1 hypothetical protein [Hyphomonas sp.]
MSARRLSILIALIALGWGHTVAETPTSPATMTFVEGRLEGEGAQLLRAELPGAQFILFGEDHGFADSPEIALALAREARAFGVVHHAMEIGPQSDAVLTDLLRIGGNTELAAFLENRPLAIPFVNMAEDARLADYFVDEAEDGIDPVRGLDQEFVGAPLVHLQTLSAAAPTHEAASLTQAWRDADHNAFAEGRLDAIMMLTATPEDFEALSRAYADLPGALGLIKDLAESAEIYALYSSGDNYASNATRVSLMRRHLLEALEATPEPAPRVLFKFGANHLARGTGPLNTFDLGSLTEGIAAANGLNALHILFVPLQGQQTVTNPAGERVFETVDYRSEEMAALLAAAGISEEAIPADGYAVIPLESVRLRLEQKGLNALSPDNRFFLLGYDYLVTTRGARPATPIVD